MNRSMRRSMRRSMLLALAALSLTRAEAALAGSSCGGGGSSSDSGGGSSSSSDTSFSFSDDSGSSSGSSAPACADETDIVGYRRCTRFGRWARGPRAVLGILELGTAVRTFRSPLRDTSGRLTHGSESFTYRVTGRPAGSLELPSESALVSTLRVGVALPRGLFVAVDGELGGLTRTASHAEMTSAGTLGAPSITPASSVVTGVLATAGVRGQAGRATLGVEAAGGVRAVIYQYESRYLACETTTTTTVSTPILEARARASYWLSPFISVGATAGASVIERGAWMAGVHLGFASEAYGGMRD